MDDQGKTHVLGSKQKVVSREVTLQSSDTQKMSDSKYDDEELRRETIRHWAGRVRQGQGKKRGPSSYIIRSTRTPASEPMHGICNTLQTMQKSVFAEWDILNCCWRS